MLRSGSTYLFATLRELNDLYCYYEPMHELVAWASTDVTRLDIETHADKMQQHSHKLPYIAKKNIQGPQQQAQSQREDRLQYQ